MKAEEISALGQRILAEEQMIRSLHEEIEWDQDENETEEASRILVERCAKLDEMHALYSREAYGM